MRFLFKIYSGYDGFRPAVIRERMEDGCVPLKWPVYFDDAERGAEVWVYFHGPHRFENGVYIKGRIRWRDLETRTVHLRPTQYSVDEPLSDPATSEQVAAAVQQRFRQVFFFPPSLVPVPECDLHAGATTCVGGHCQECSRWNELPSIGGESFRIPERLSTEDGIVFRAGVWVIPSRCYRRMHTIPRGVHDTSNLFYRFKVGDDNVAFPLAGFIDRAIRCDGRIELDSIEAIVPVPLSPDKARLGEVHRTRALASRLSELTGIPAREVVSLRRPVSKRRLMHDEGWSMAQFERYYLSLLEVDPEVRDLQSVMVIDDVATRGSTLRCIARALRGIREDLEILSVAAGQMILKATCQTLP